MNTCLSRGRDLVQQWFGIISWVFFSPSYLWLRFLRSSACLFLMLSCFSLLDLDLSFLQWSPTHCTTSTLSLPVTHTRLSQSKHGGPYMKSGLNSLTSLSSTGSSRLTARFTTRLAAEFACAWPLAVLPCGVSAPLTRPTPATPAATPSI